MNVETAGRVALSHLRERLFIINKVIIAKHLLSFSALCWPAVIVLLALVHT